MVANNTVPKRALLGDRRLLIGVMLAGVAAIVGAALIVNIRAAVLPGDINGDGEVNVTDLSLMLANYGKPGTPAQGDISGDGQVDITDLSLLLSNFGKRAAAVAVNDNTIGTGPNEFEYVGAWQYGAATGIGLHQDDNHWSNAAGAYYQFRFSGTTVGLHASKAQSHGEAAISIDGGAETIVDLYSPARQDGIQVFSRTGLPGGAHTLKVRVTGTKNAAATNTFITADKAVVGGSAGSPTTSPSPTPTSQPAGASALYTGMHNGKPAILRKSDNQPVILRGANIVSHWIDQPGQTWGQSAYDEIKSKGGNVVRHVWYWQPAEPSPGQFNQQAFDTWKTAVARAKAAGLYSVVEIHYTGALHTVPAWVDKTSAVTIGQSARGLMGRLAQTFKDEPTVIFDPINEIPAWSSAVGQHHPNLIMDYNQIVIDAIRQYAPDHLIMIGPGYHDRSHLPDNPAMQGSWSHTPRHANTVWKWHSYFTGTGDNDGYNFDGHQAGDQAWTGGGSYANTDAARQAMENNLLEQLAFANQAGLPLWCGEWSMQPGRPGVSEFVRDKTALLRKYAVGHAWWEYNSLPSWKNYPGIFN